VGGERGEEGRDSEAAWSIEHRSALFSMWGLRRTPVPPLLVLVLGLFLVRGGHSAVSTPSVVSQTIYDTYNSFPVDVTAPRSNGSSFEVEIMVWITDQHVSDWFSSHTCARPFLVVICLYFIR
jgi:hypothetical protein